MAGEMRLPGIHNPHGPGKRANQDGERAKEYTGPRGESTSPHEEAHAAESQNEAGQQRCIGAPASGNDGKKQEYPERLAGDEARGEARRHLLLRPVQGAVATEKEESADDEAGADLRPGGPQALGKAPRQKNQAGDEVPDSGGGAPGPGWLQVPPRRLLISRTWGHP